jgi:hypothetical protein
MGQVFDLEHHPSAMESRLDRIELMLGQLINERTLHSGSPVGSEHPLAPAQKPIDQYGGARV